MDAIEIGDLLAFTAIYDNRKARTRTSWRG